MREQIVVNSAESLWNTKLECKICKEEANLSSKEHQIQKYHTRDKCVTDILYIHKFHWRDKPITYRSLVLKVYWVGKYMSLKQKVQKLYRRDKSVTNKLSMQKLYWIEEYKIDEQ